MAALSLTICGIKFADDIQDSGSLRARGMRRAYAKPIELAHQELRDLQFPLDELEQVLGEQLEIEARLEDDLHIASSPTGTCYGMAAAALAQYSSTSPAAAREIGERLGRLVYLIDAFRDRNDDGPSDYNPLRCASGRVWPSVPTSNLRAFDEHIVELLDETKELCSAVPGRMQERWSMLRRTLTSVVARDPDSVTLNLVCFVPCDDDGAAIGVDPSHCCGMICWCCMCAWCGCNAISH